MFCKTKSSGKTLDNRQKILCAALPFGTNWYHTVPLGTIQYHLLFVLFYRILIECPKPFYMGFLVSFFHTNNPVFCKTNSSGKTVDTRQNILCASLDTPDVFKALFEIFSKGSACELLVEVLL